MKLGLIFWGALALLCVVSWLDQNKWHSFWSYEQLGHWTHCQSEVKGEDTHWVCAEGEIWIGVGK